MANYGYIIPQKVAAQDVRTLNRSAIHASVDMENGGVVLLASKSSTAGEGEVWTATQLSGGAGLTNVWMVYSPEINVTGGYYKGLDPDPRHFLNLATYVFDCFKPQVGDIVLFSEDAVGGSKATGDYAVATASQWQLQWAAAAVSGLSFKVIATTTLSLATGAVDTQRLVAYQMECVAVA